MVTLASAPSTGHAAAFTAAAAPPGSNMGRQSNQNRTLAQRKQHLKASSGSKRKNQQQQTLTGKRGFEAEKDCPNCRTTGSHKRHHDLCSKNQSTKGLFSKTTVASNAESQRLRAEFERPLLPSEKASGPVSREDLAFFFKSNTSKEECKKNEPYKKQQQHQHQHGGYCRRVVSGSNHQHNGAVRFEVRCAEAHYGGCRICR